MLVIIRMSGRRSFAIGGFSTAEKGEGSECTTAEGRLHEEEEARARPYRSVHTYHTRPRAHGAGLHGVPGPKEDSNRETEPGAVGPASVATRPINHADIRCPHAGRV